MNEGWAKNNAVFPLMTIEQFTFRTDGHRQYNAKNLSARDYDFVRDWLIST